MARVITRTKSSRGKPATCRRCGREIKPGEKYHSWTPFRSYTRTQCAEHYPRRSEVSTSIVAEVYAAVEAAEEQLPGAESVDDVKAIVDEVVAAVDEVAEQYREAAEPFGGAGENAERADELEGWSSELQDFSPEEPAADDLQERVEAQMEKDGFTREDEAEWISVLEVRMEEAEAEDSGAAEALEKARDEAADLIGGCPV